MRTTTSRPSRRVRLAVAALAPAALLLGACANPDAPGAQPTSIDEHAPVSLTDAREAVGTWTVVGAAADPGTVVQIGYGFTLWLDCGRVEGSYLLGTDGALLTDAWAGSGTCDVPNLPAWLDDAASLATAGDDLVLLGADGIATATLTPGGTPKVPAHDSPDLAKDPVLDDALRAALDPASPALPAGVTAATTDELVGRWLPAEPVGDPEASYLTLAADGTWTGSDGCNGAQGLWLSDKGSWRATSGPQTLIYCEGVQMPMFASTARAAGLDADGSLVLVDAEGAELVRLVKKA
ncbi:META domain-containing protein [Sanguibacter massiliensis]|uniref:META domain-containing protein n=1 Tax=Sanguibacter massiliensis TaxID=1973217 RepID=UPI00101AE92C|nr:META domain-containing protein [Sanguibacter massiliensis]